MELRCRDVLSYDVFEGSSVLFSPDCRFIAVLKSNAKIAILSALTFEEVYCIISSGPIRFLEWSLDSKFLLVFMKSLNSVQVYFVEKTASEAEIVTSPYTGISGGIIGTERVIWNSKMNIVLLVGAASSQLFAWKINDKEIVRLPCPKNAESAIKFSHDGLILAELSRDTGKDLLVLIDAETCKTKGVIELTTLDATAIEWSLDGTFVIVIDSISNHLLEIVNLNTNQVIEHSAYEGYLGITLARVCPNSKIIAVGGFDGYVRLLVAPEWKLLAEFFHEPSVKNDSVVIHQEASNDFYEAYPPLDLEVSLSPTNGITHIEWSPTGRLLATWSTKTPSVLFIWNAEMVSLTNVIICKSSISQFCWSPTEDIVAVATGKAFIVTWSPTEIIRTPTNSVCADSFSWREDGNEILILNKSGKFCVACRQ